MRTTTTAADSRPQPSDSALTLKKRALGLHGARLLSWKAVLVQNFGRELQALYVQQQERAFMATSHGLTYASWRSDKPSLH